MGSLFEAKKVLGSIGVLEFFTWLWQVAFSSNGEKSSPEIRKKWRSVLKCGSHFVVAYAFVIHLHDKSSWEIRLRSFHLETAEQI